MKVSELVNELSTIDGENDLFLEVDGKLYKVEMVRTGQFFKSNVISARVDFDIVRAEQTLISCLQFQRDQLKGYVLDRIERALGKERVEKITKSFDEFAEQSKKEQEENKELIEEIQEKVNSQTGFEGDEPPSLTEQLEEIPLDVAKTMLKEFYSGKKSYSVDELKLAKSLVGDEESKQIFEESRR